MENYQELLERIRETKYTVKGNKMKQTERNNLKEEVITALSSDLVNAIGRTKDGIVLELENEEEGAIYATLDVKFKNLDYDPVHEIEEFSSVIEKRIERENERQKVREEGAE